MSFPFKKLPTELACEIVQHATITTGKVLVTQARNEVYRMACSLALVSASIREITMPCLLHTIILPTHESIGLFLRSLNDQKSLATSGSRLKLDYTKLVRRFWSTECYEPIPGEPSAYYNDYRDLYNIFCNARHIGFNFRSTHLLYDVLEKAHSMKNLPPGQCTHVTFAGDLQRWNSLTSTAFGLAFLRNITHITVWGPIVFNLNLPTLNGRVPSWVSKIPFKCMPNLIHFACTLNPTGKGISSILMYTLPPSPDGRIIQDGGVTFQKWVTSDDAISYCKICPLDVGKPVSGCIPAANWEMAFYRGDNNMWHVSK